MHDVERELKDLGERTEVAYRSVPARRIVRRARLRRSIAVVVPTAAAVLLAAVVYPTLADLRRGSGGGSADLSAVARVTKGAETARVELRTTMEIGGETHTTRGVGKVDFERRRSHLRMAGIGPDGSERGEMISIGDTAYQRTDGSKWFEFELDGGAFGAGAGPADMLPYLEAMSEEVTNLGNEEIDGVSVTHYRATIDPGIFGDLGPAAFTTEFEFDPMHVWVDDLGRLRKLTFGTSVHDERGSDASMEMTMRLWDFGIPVEVVAPDPEEITEEPLRAGESGGFSRSLGGDVTGETSFGYVYGEGGPSAPHIVVIQHEDDPPLVCAKFLPEGSAAASLMDETSGARVDLDQELLQSVGGGGCADHHDADTVAARILDDPSRYTLHIEVESGEDLAIPLRTVQTPFKTVEAVD